MARIQSTTLTPIITIEEKFGVLFSIDEARGLLKVENLKAVVTSKYPDSIDCYFVYFHHFKIKL